MKNLLLLASSLLASTSLAAPLKGKHFETVVIVMFENTNYKTALEQPFFDQFAAKGALLTNSVGVIHPSQGNYIALTSGDINGAPDDEIYEIKARNIADLLSEKGLTWKAYAENYPGDCFKGRRAGDYWRKHNPMASYTTVTSDPKRCANIVNADQFEIDAKKGQLPNYAFFVPNIKNDGHDTGPVFASQWFEKRFKKIVENEKEMKDAIIIATFDENAGEADMRVYTAVVGPSVKAHFHSNDPVSHYSVLRMIEDNFALGTLGKNDVTAKPFPNIWK